MISRVVPLSILILASLTTPLLAQTDDSDAAQLYMQANNLIRTDSPSTSNLSDYRMFPPYSPAWQTMEEQAFTENHLALDTIHQASSLDHANWPPGQAGLTYLSMARNLANQAGDAALYLDLKGDDAQAMQHINDLLHLADLLTNQTNPTLVQLLVGNGIRALTLSRVDIIASNIQLSSNPADTRAVQLSDARALIAALLATPSVPDQLTAAGTELAHVPDPKHKRLIETLNRCRAECVMGAMSLACHLYYFDNHHWPATLADLIPNYLPRADIDPWGNGQQTFGYVLIPRALPDGSDRPLVFCRCRSTDGLFFRTDQPNYDFYVSDGSGQPSALQKQGGQFRDVARWTPTAPYPPPPDRGPSTQPLP